MIWRLCVFGVRACMQLSEEKIYNRADLERRQNRPKWLKIDAKSTVDSCLIAHWCHCFLYVVYYVLNSYGFFASMEMWQLLSLLILGSNTWTKSYCSPTSLLHPLDINTDIWHQKEHVMNCLLYPLSGLSCLRLKRLTLLLRVHVKIRLLIICKLTKRHALER